MTAEALVSRQLLGWPRDFPALVKGVGQVSAHLQEGGDRNIYYWYYATQLLHNMRNEQWERWNPKIREGLIGLQVKDDTCAKGSWDPFSPVPDIWAERAGRLYLTSLSILTLEVYYRYLPLYRTADDDQEKMDSILKADDGPDDREGRSGEPRRRASRVRHQKRRDRGCQPPQRVEGPAEPSAREPSADRRRHERRADGSETA